MNTTVTFTHRLRPDLRDAARRLRGEPVAPSPEDPRLVDTRIELLRAQARIRQLETALGYYRAAARRPIREVDNLALRRRLAQPRDPAVKIIDTRRPIGRIRPA